MGFLARVYVIDLEENCHKKKGNGGLPRVDIIEEGILKSYYMDGDGL